MEGQGHTEGVPSIFTSSFAPAGLEPEFLGQQEFRTESSTPPPYLETPPVSTNSELERMKRELEELRRQPALSPASVPTPALAPANPELERMKRELEELRKPRAVSPAAPTNSELERMKKELEELRRQPAPAPAPTPAFAPANPELERMKRELEELREPIPSSSLTSSAIPSPAPQGISELERMKKELEELRRQPAPAPAPAPTPAFAPANPELERMKRELEELRRQPAAPAPAPAPTHSVNPEVELVKKQLEELRRHSSAPPPYTEAAPASAELERMKRELEELKRKPEPEPTPSPASSELERMKRELEELRRKPAPQAPASSELERMKRELEELKRKPEPEPTPSPATSELERMKRELEELRRKPAPQAPAPAPAPASPVNPEVELLKKQIEELKRQPAPQPMPPASSSSREVEELRKQILALSDPSQTGPRESEADKIRREIAEEKRRKEQGEVERLKRELEAIRSGFSPSPHATLAPTPPVLTPHQREIEELKHQLAQIRGGGPPSLISKGDPFNSAYGAAPSPLTPGTSYPPIPPSASRGDPYTSPFGTPFTTNPASRGDPYASPYGPGPTGFSAPFSASRGDPYSSPYGGHYPPSPGQFPYPGYPGYPGHPSSPGFPSPLPTTPPASASSSSSSPSQKPQGSRSKEVEEQKRKLADMEAKKAQLQNAPTMSSATMTEGMIKKEAELRELARKLGATTSYSTLAAEKQKMELEYTQKMYGVDILFLMDCTGSMTPWIEATKEKVLELSRAVKDIKATKPPHFRLGFLGYRDVEYQERFIPVDFFDLNDQLAVEHFRARLAQIKPIGGQDEPEDIAGAMDYGLNKFTWHASTRLVIHFADAPCHGTKYHQLGDRFTGGCPNGLDPEALLERYVSKGIAYYFGEIAPSYTKKMTDIFSQNMRMIQKEQMFKVVAMSSPSASFLPEVVKSVKDSMMRTGLLV